jgi:hypothetical protein
MGKISIGLRGWRFDEAAVLGDDGTVRPLDEIPEEQRQRLVRLEQLLDRPCDACYLIHGEADKQRCRQATIVYGEPFDEVLLCDAHEPDFLYWFREAGGRDLQGDEAFRDAFHEWFADGGRAPDGYAGLDHVETDPDSLPEPPTQQEIQEHLEEVTGVPTRQVARVDPDGDGGGKGGGAGDGGSGSGSDDADAGTTTDGTGDDADRAGPDDADEDGHDADSESEADEGDEGPDDDLDLDLGREYPTG